MKKLWHIFGTLDDDSNEEFTLRDPFEGTKEELEDYLYLLNQWQEECGGALSYAARLLK